MLCVEGVCPADAPEHMADAETCEQCILSGGAWLGRTGVCSDACLDETDCSTTRCPDGSG